MGTKTFNRANPAKKQKETYNDFSGGINTETADNAMKDNQFRKLINFDMDQAGSISKRPGLYRIPFVQKEIEKQLVIEQQQGRIDDLRNLKIEDCKMFNDGAHWVFNYITNKGLVVAILNNDLTSLADLSYTLNQQEIKFNSILFYPHSEDIVADKRNKYSIKISSFGSQFVLYKSFYAKPDNKLEVEKKQVRLFSWCPILKVVEAPFSNEPYDVEKSFFPGWVEATDGDKIRQENYLGEEETKIVASKSISQIIPLLDNNTNTFELISATPNSRVACYDFNEDVNSKGIKVEYKATGILGSYLLVSNKIAGVLQTPVQIPLLHQDGNNIKDNEIAQIVYFDSNTIRVYLNDKVKYSADFVFTNPDKQMQGLIKWFDVDLITKTINYPTDPGTDLVFKAPMFPPDTIPIINGPIAESTVLKTDKGTSRSSNIIFQEDGIPFEYNLKWTTGVAQPYLGPESVYDNSLGIPIKPYDDFNGPIGSHIFTNSWTDSSNVPNAGHKNLINYKGFKPPKNQYKAIDPTSTPSHKFKNLRTDAIWLEDKTTNKLDRTSYSFVPSINKQFSQFMGYAKSYNTEQLWSGDFSCYITLTAKSQPAKWKNNLLTNDRFGLGSTSYEVKYKINNVETTKNITTGIINGDNFTFENLSISNLPSYLLDNDINLDTSNKIFGKDLFDLTELEMIDRDTLTGRVPEIKINASYTLNGAQTLLETSFRPYDINDFLNAMLNTTEKRVVIDSTMYNGVAYNISLYWLDDNNVKHFIVDLSNETIPQLTSNRNEIYNTLKINIVYDFLEQGYSTKSINFKQLKYIKPNLNDFNYVWYNMNLFSSYNSSRYPDFYDSTAHPNISWDLVQYPTKTLTSGRLVELFSIVPVNNVILAPGKQRFQLFYNAVEGALDKVLIAITAMPVKDYVNMISSPDFSTTGYTQDGKPREGVITPTWVDWNTVFPDSINPYDDDRTFDETTKTWIKTPKKAVLELDIPSTTEPYMVKIQVANKMTQNTKPPEGQTGEGTTEYLDKIQVATLTETQIEMQPNASNLVRLSPLSLFDEYTASKYLTTYTSHLIAYGGSNKIFFSDVSTPSYFPISRYLEIKTPEEIKSCLVFQNKLIVSTENSRYYIGGSSFDDVNNPIHIKEISSDSGILAPKTDVPMGNYLYFLDKGGIKILKNLYGTADKEFSYANLDEFIKNQVPKDEDACAVAFQNKYYICFPNHRYMLVYNQEYNAWVSYEGEFINFTRMFVNNNELYAIGRDNFNIYKFSEDVLVDNWNEIENGYEEMIAIDGSVEQVQKGSKIKCIMQTKNLDQDYVPHRKKYDWAALNANVDGITSNIVPYVYVDDNLINYDFGIKETIEQDNVSVYSYVEKDPEGLILRDGSKLGQSTILNFNRLGLNDTAYYNIPVRRTGNTIAFGFTFDNPSKLTIKSLTIRYGLKEDRRNKRGIS